MIKRDLTGMRSLRLIAVRATGTNKFGKTLWLCQCDCGNFHRVEAARIQSGEAKSCGCLLRELYASGALRRTHGRAGSRAYDAWKNMIARCENPKNPGYHRYGGRGISVCQGWHDLSVFIAEMGDPGPGLTLERIDNSKGYSLQNCRWATRMEQGQNTRRTVRITFQNETHSIREWSRKTGIPRTTIKGKIDRGVPIELIFAPALTEDDYR